MTKYVCKLEYPNLRIEITYIYEKYENDYVNEVCEIYYCNKHIYTLVPFLYNYEETKKKELGRLYKILRKELKICKKEVNSILGAVGNLLYLIHERLYLPRRAVKIS